MLKFRCQHCGQRIAVPARHLGKLVTCAECGRATHPLAEQWERAKPQAAAQPQPQSLAASCANCDKEIGRLQSSHVWQSQRVCAPCYHALSAESTPPVVEPATETRVTRVVPPPEPPPPQPLHLPLRERMTRALVVFVVAVVALYGALTLLRDIAGLVAVAAVAVLALVGLYGVFRARLGAGAKTDRGGALTAR